MVLLRLIRRADRAKVQMALACGRGGELLKTLPADVPAVDYTSDATTSGVSTLSRLSRRALDSFYYRTHTYLYRHAPTLTRGAGEQNIARIHESFKPDFWYLNTLILPNVLRLARARGVPCVVHSHEMEQILDHLGADDVDNLVRYPQLVIAASQASANVLRRLGRVENLEVLNEPLETGEIRSDPAAARAVRKTLGIGERAFVWMMSGSRDLNKDPALFVEAAGALSKVDDAARFVWLGGADGGYSVFARRLAASLGVADRITWVEARAGDYYDYLNVADGFVLTSRRDTCPLVLLEAAALGKPVVSFDSGGAREIIEPGMGLVVESWNVADLVAAMLKVMRGEARHDAEVSRRRAAAFDTSVIVRRWEEILEAHFPAR